MKRITKFRRSVKAISPIISVLLMIAIAVSAALVAFAWVSGYMDFTTTKVGKSIQIQSVSTNAAYVQNVGDSPVTLVDVYVDDNLVTAYTMDPPTGELAASETAAILFDVPFESNRVTIKIVTTGGISAEYTETFSGATGGAATPVWLYRKQITIQSSRVAGTGSHSNFPVLISLSNDAQLAANALDSGYDIKFVASDENTQLDHEIESFNGDTGALVAWVNVPALSATSDTLIYMYYGNAEATNQQSPERVWNTNYKGVWHLAETGTGVADEYKDSTQNNNDGQGGSGVQSPTLASGQVNGAQDFVRNDDDFITIENDESLKIEDSITLEAWIKIDSVSGWNMIVARQYDTGTGDGYLLGLNSGRQAVILVRGNPVLYSSALTLGQYYHIVGTCTPGTNNIKLYINGNQVTQNTASAWTLDENPVTIGAGENGDVGTDPTEQFDGIIDEVRVSNTVRSGTWIQTEYNNMHEPSSFVALGGETSVYP